MAKRSDKEYLELWRQFKENISKATPVDLSETPADREKRVRDLEKDPEAWFKYYFPNFYTAEPADFHKKATKRVLSSPEYYEVRSWARELSKSGRTMFEVLFLALTGKKKNILLVSSSYDNAERLLLPYKTILEANNRIINDYGKQQSLGKWEAGEFTTTKGVAFRALGEGQNPRGTKNDAFRPDVILIDDIDTDEACRNKDRVKNKIKWVEEALIPTRSISNPLLIIVCGNLIAKYCCVGELGKKADMHDIVNIIDKAGNSNWPQKNKPEHIARIRKQVSSNSFQKEYMNNPINEGDTFKEVNYGKCPKVQTCEAVVVYADPSTSNRNKGGKGSSSKSIVIVGRKAFQYFVYRVWVAHESNSTFVDWIFEAERFLDFNQVDPKKIWIENNSLQDPFYTQVILPLIYKRCREKRRDDAPPIRPDRRKKPEKYDRIEGTLEPIHSAGNLIFNEEIKGTTHMVEMEDQMLAVSEGCKIMDGPDALEGGVWLLQNKKAKKSTSYATSARESRHY